MNSTDPLVTALSLQVADLRQLLADLQTKVHALEHDDAKKHDPGQSIKWWDLTEEARELEVARLRGWERDVLVPMLGYSLPECWPLHIPACARVESLYELWATCWLSNRTRSVLASQAEYFIRYLPQLAEEIRALCRSCEHAAPRSVTGVA